MVRIEVKVWTTFCTLDGRRRRQAYCNPILNLSITLSRKHNHTQPRTITHQILSSAI